MGRNVRGPWPTVGLAVDSIDHGSNLDSYNMKQKTISWLTTAKKKTKNNTKPINFRMPKLRKYELRQNKNEKPKGKMSAYLFFYVSHLEELKRKNEKVK